MVSLRFSGGGAPLWPAQTVAARRSDDGMAGESSGEGGFWAKEGSRNVDHLSLLPQPMRFEFGHFGGKRPKCPHSLSLGPAALSGKKVFWQPFKFLISSFKIFKCR